VIGKNRRVAVVGAGISGLMCAYELQKLGFEVEVFEKRDCVGGRMASRRISTFLFDTGANFFVNNYKNIPYYCKELGIEKQWRPMHMGNIYSFWKGELHPVSTKLSDTLFRLDVLPFMDRVKLIRMYHDLAKKGKEVNFYDLSSTLKYDTINAYDYTEEHVSKLAADYITDPFTRTYQFHSAKEMSLGAMIGIMGAMMNHNEEFSFYYTEGGMGELPKALASKLHVKKNQPIRAIVGGQEKIHLMQGDNALYFDYCVLATTADVSRVLYLNPTDKQEKLLNDVHYAQTIMSAFTIPKSLIGDLSLTMVPFVEGGKIAEYTQEAFKGRGFETEELSVMNAGLHEEFAKEIMQKSDEEIFALIKEALIACCPLLRGHEDQLKPLDLQRWNNAMPKFSTHYLTHVDHFMQNGQGGNRIFLCGDYLNSPWTEGSCECGKKVAKQLDSVVKNAEEALSIALKISV
jgi:protoporphyrinogen/coproporphyrinogen III oxidase